MSEKPPKIRVRRAALRAKHRVKPRRVVRPNPEPYHRLQGWRNDCGTYKGDFACAGQRFPGEVFRHRSGVWGARVTDLPDEVLEGPHGACFSLDFLRPGWWRVHFAQRPPSLDAAILSVEESIKESLEC